jgi:hypothetical protein
MRIKTFVGTRFNALQIQIWTALSRCSCSSSCSCALALAGVCPISTLCYANRCAPIATCSPGSTNRSSRRCSTPTPSNWRFSCELSLDSRNSNLNLQIATEARKRPGVLHSHAPILANLDSSDLTLNSFLAKATMDTPWSAHASSSADYLLRLTKCFDRTSRDLRQYQLHLHSHPLPLTTHD